MNEQERALWHGRAQELTKLAARATALAAGYRDGHGGSLGDPAAAADRWHTELAAFTRGVGPAPQRLIALSGAQFDPQPITSSNQGTECSPLQPRA